MTASQRHLALDIGDRWVGVAISDPLGITIRPYVTLEFKQLIPELTKIILQERVGTVLVGLPVTLKGTDSDQTRRVRDIFEKLKIKFIDTRFILCDERLSSSQAGAIARQSGLSQKKQSDHARAAALILSGYLAHTKLDY